MPYINYSSVCAEGAWICGPPDPQNCAASIQCAGNTIFRTDIKLCGATCDTFKTAYLCGQQEPVSGCGCPDGLVLDADVSFYYSDFSGLKNYFKTFGWLSWLKHHFFPLVG